jgi:O-antigen ligase
VKAGQAPPSGSPEIIIRSPLAYGVIALAAALIFGGASQDNAASLAAAELVSLPALVFGVWVTARGPRAGRLTWPLILLAAAILVPCLQLIPLPPAVWTRLPARAGVIAVLQAARLPLRAMPFSLTPELTLHCALALIPPAAVFVITLNLQVASRMILARIIAILAVASLLLGLLQIAGGPESPLRFYRNTNLDSPVGFFSNRDHFADFLACAVPLALVAFAGPLGASGPGRWVRMAPVLALTPILVMGVAITASRAGVILIVIALAGGFALTPPRRREARLGLGLMATVGLVLMVAIALGRIPALGRFAEGAGDPRFTAAPTVFKAVRAYWPMGSGVGSFIPIYQTFEPTRLVDPAIFNHAHDDFLESALESGAAAVLVLAGFLAWFASRCHAAWLKSGEAGATSLARAGSLIVIMILVHSTVDYPLRTVAMTSLFAFACALLVPGPEKQDSTDDTDRHRSAVGAAAGRV